MRSENVNACLRLLGAGIVFCMGLVGPGNGLANSGGMTFVRLSTCQSETTQATAVQPCFNASTPSGAHYVLALGQIERRSAEALAEVAGDLPKGATIVFQSLGGDLLGGLMLGQYIRARELNTLVADAALLGGVTPKDSASYQKCISACAYAFLGGVQRRVAQGAELGVHQFRSKENNLDPVQTQKIAAILGKYMDSMGVSRNLLDQALMTEPGRVTLVSELNRKSWGVESSKQADKDVPHLWRASTSTGGRRLVYQSKKQLASDAIVTIAMVRFESQLKLLLIVKPDPTQEGSRAWADFFKQPTDTQIRVNSTLVVLKPEGAWTRAGSVNTEGTRQIWYALDSALVQRLEAGDDMGVQSLWQDRPLGLDRETHFSTQGLASLLSAL